MDIAALAERFGENHNLVVAALEKSAQKAAALEAKATSVETKTDGLAQDLANLHQKLIRTGSGGLPALPKSLGAEFAASPEVKAFAQEIHRPSRVRVESKTITNANTSGGPLWQPYRDTTTMLPTQSLPIRSLLNVIGVSDASSVEYAVQTGPRPSAAAMVSEGSAKPETDLAWTLKTVKLEVCAVWLAASRQVLSDATQLRGIIDQELTYQIKVKEESEILYGTGVSPHLAGIIPQATAFAAPITIPTPTMLDTIATAVLQLGLLGWQATGICLHPSDYARTALIKDSTGQYIAGNPQAAMTPVLWGIPVSICQTLLPDQFLIGDFRQATLYDREAVNLMASSEHSDFFVKNLVALLVEERIGLAVKSPSAFIVGDLGNLP